LGLILTLQLVSGLLLTLHFTPDPTLAFDSVEYITREVSFGWFVRLWHINGARIFFIVLYIHIFKALLVEGYRSTAVWVTG